MGAIELACYSDLSGFEVLPIVLILVVIESTELSALLEDLIAGNQVDGECGDNANPFSGQYWRQTMCGGTYQAGA